MATYSILNRTKRGWHNLLRGLVVIVLVGLILGAFGLWHRYNSGLLPVSASQTVVPIIIPTGSTSNQIAAKLKLAGLIRSQLVFEAYIRLNGLTNKLQAGTYALKASDSLAQIVDMIAHGKIELNLIIILPAQRLDQIKDAFINAKFNPDAVAKAFDPSQYNDIPVLADKPAAASLEGYLYPDTFQRDSQTNPSVIVRESLTEMNQYVTPAIKATFRAEGLTVYQGITLASIVEQEVSKPADRNQVAQVFISRLQQNMPLGSDVTYIYSQRIHDPSYDTTSVKGLPPGPISNVSASSLQAVANPATTSWLYFVAGDDGTTYFSKTLDEHNQQIKLYCHKLCPQN